MFLFHPTLQARCLDNEQYRITCQMSVAKAYSVMTLHLLQLQFVCLRQEMFMEKN